MEVAVGIPVGIGVMMTVRNGAIGILVTAVAVVSLVLMIRLVRSTPQRGESAMATTTRDEDALLDYVVWAFIGVPLLLAFGAVILVVTGAFQ